MIKIYAPGDDLEKYPPGEDGRINIPIDLSYFIGCNPYSIGQEPIPASKPFLWRGSIMQIFFAQVRVRQELRRWRKTISSGYEYMEFTAPGIRGCISGECVQPEFSIVPPPTKDWRYFPEFGLYYNLVADNHGNELSLEQCQELVTITNSDEQVTVANPFSDIPFVFQGLDGFIISFYLFNWFVDVFLYFWSSYRQKILPNIANTVGALLLGNVAFTNIDAPRRKRNKV